MYFHLNNVQADNCLLKNGLDLGSNLFPYYNFWVDLSGRNADGLGSRCTFKLTMCKATNAFQKTDRIR